MVIGICYGIGCSAFLALIVLMLLKRRPAGFGLRFLVVCVITAVWAAVAAAQTWWSPGLAHLMESVRSAAWLFLVASVLTENSRTSQQSSSSRWLPALAVLIGIASVANDLRFLSPSYNPAAFASSQILGRVVVAISGILAVENLIRNTAANRKWHVFPLCIAIGALFSYDLFVFSEAVILRQVSATLLAGRGLVLAMIVPLLMLTMARNPGWRIDIHVSRRIVFHTATLMAAGIFLVAAAGVAVLIGHFPGEWASVSEVAFLCGSIVLLAFVVSTESVRARLRRTISENFFSTRYDYRIEWLRCIATLSSVRADEPLTIRSVRALADVVDSPGGALWLQGADGCYRIEQCLNLALDINASEPPSGAFMRGFQDGGTVQVFRGLTSAGHSQQSVPGWAADASALWLAVPLIRVDHILGFVVLTRPRAPMTLNWESFDLLLAIGQQVAGYLSEERATRTLLESRALIDFSKRFSFVIHDVKNISGQLGMMVANVRAFGDQPEFRADLVRSMESGIEKLKGVLDRLRPDVDQSDREQWANPGSVIDAVVGEVIRGDVALWTEIAAEEMTVRIVPTVLHAVLTHLVTNAIEASQAGETVIVRLREEGGRAVIDVVDEGCGMTPEFIRNGLFIPFKSTKARGHGIGAYQARELLRAASGELEVFSNPERGTTMRVVIPFAVDNAREPPGMAVAR